MSCRNNVAFAPRMPQAFGPCRCFCMRCLYVLSCVFLKKCDKGLQAIFDFLPGIWILGTSWGPSVGPTSTPTISTPSKATPGTLHAFKSYGYSSFSIFCCDVAISWFYFFIRIHLLLLVLNLTRRHHRPNGNNVSAWNPPRYLGFNDIIWIQ